MNTKLNHKTKTALRFGVSALIVLLVSGCAVTPEAFAKATSACKSHGGLKAYFVFPWTQTHCQDGTVIKTLGN